VDGAAIGDLQQPCPLLIIQRAGQGQLPVEPVQARIPVLEMFLVLGMDPGMLEPDHRLLEPDAERKSSRGSGV
jgi:hypothetical protein